MNSQFKLISKQTMYKGKQFFKKDAQGILTLCDFPSFEHNVELDEVLSATKFSNFNMEEWDFLSNFSSSVEIVEYEGEKYLLTYHVTMDDFLSTIQLEGLKPKIGHLSESIGEENEQIYLFPSLEIMNDALLNWFGEAYEEYCEEFDIDIDDLILHSLYVLIPLNAIQDYLEESFVGFELVSQTPIPKELIFYHSEQ